MSTQVGQCSNCRAPNSYKALNCIECGARLPWADALQSAQATPVATPSVAPAAQQVMPVQVQIVTPPEVYKQRRKIALWWTLGCFAFPIMLLIIGILGAILKAVGLAK